MNTTLSPTSAMNAIWGGTVTPGEVFFSVLAAIWCVLVVKKWSYERSRLPPGPPGLPLIGNLRSVRGNFLERLFELAQTYGPIFSLRLGHKLCVVVTSAPLARELLKEQDAVFANRDVPTPAKVLPNGEEGLVWAPHGPVWRAVRKLAVAEMLNHARLDAYHDLRAREVGRMVRRVSDNVGSGVEIQRLMYDTVYNVVAGMLWGDTLEQEGMDRVRAEFEEAVEEMRGSFRGLGIEDIFPFLKPFDVQGIVRRRRKLSEKFHRVLDAIIDRRVEMASSGGEDDRKDFLRLVLRVDKKGDAAALPTRTHFKALIIDLVMAGIDTTAYAMEWAMAELMNNPNAMRKAKDELDQVVGKWSRVKETDIPKLQYLHAVVKETLRLRPTVPLMLPRTPSQTATVSGFTVPTGTRVLINLCAIQRDPQAWENPMEFRPERFLTENRTGDFSGNDFSFFPFGSGRRMCPGAALADVMLTYTLATLLHLFDWNLPEGAELQLSEEFALALKMTNALLAVPAKRLSDPTLYSPQV